MKLGKKLFISCMYRYYSRLTNMNIHQILKKAALPIVFLILIKIFLLTSGFKEFHSLAVYSCKKIPFEIKKTPRHIKNESILFEKIKLPVLLTNAFWCFARQILPKNVFSRFSRFIRTQSFLIHLWLSPSLPQLYLSVSVICLSFRFRR